MRKTDASALSQRRRTGSYTLDRRQSRQAVGDWPVKPASSRLMCPWSAKPQSAAIIRAIPAGFTAPTLLSEDAVRSILAAEPNDRDGGAG